MHGVIAFAMVFAARSMADDPRLLVAGVCLAGALLVGAFLIALVQRWRRRQEAPTLTPEQQLSEYRLLYEQGTLSQEEFERLRALLGRQLKPEGTPPGPGKEDPPPRLPSDGIRPG